MRSTRERKLSERGTDYTGECIREMDVFIKEREGRSLLEENIKMRGTRERNN